MGPKVCLASIVDCGAPGAFSVVLTQRGDLRTALLVRLDARASTRPLSFVCACFVRVPGDAWSLRVSGGGLDRPREMQAVLEARRELFKDAWPARPACGHDIRGRGGGTLLEP